MQFKCPASTHIIMFEYEAKKLFTKCQALGGYGASARCQAAKQIVAFSCAEQNMDFLQTLRTLSMNLFIPFLAIEHLLNACEKTHTEFKNVLVLPIPGLHQRVQDTLLISRIEGKYREEASFASHLLNIMNKLVKMFLHFLGVRQQIDRVLKGVCPQVV
jgi:hypothetical protein